MTPLTKREALKMAATASSITREENETAYSGSTSLVERSVSFTEMTSEIKEFGHGRWWANQVDSKVFLSLPAGISFIIEVR